MGLVGWQFNLHLDTIDRVIDHHTTLVIQVVNVHVSQTINQQSKIIGGGLNNPTIDYELDA